MNGLNILVVEDDDDLREALCDTLRLNGFQCYEARDGEEGFVKLDRHEIQFVVSDVNMPRMDGHEFLKLVKSRKPMTPVLLITAYGTISNAVDAMQHGAVDYLVKPFEPVTLIDTISKHLQPVEEKDFDEPVAIEPSSQQLLSLARKVSKTDSTILISGESGTGKEVLARYIHNHSNRSEKPFIAINCAAIPENMLEATLFGHEKGAFTGAVSSAPGKFEQANGGTILLDEISEMELALQAKLLRVLQEREVERVGGRKTIKLDVRVLATTNRNLIDEVKLGHFREDLYYRLSVFPLQWKPLRDRKRDLIPLAEKLIMVHGKKLGLSGLRLDQSAKEAIVSHAWPGNVRELDNAIQRSLIMQSGNVITSADLGLVDPSILDFESNRSNAPGSPVNAQPSAAAGETELNTEVKHKEFEIIVDAIRNCNGRKKDAAEKLGISPRTLRYKLAKLREMGVDVDSVLSAA